MKVCIFDIETTGLFEFKLPADHPSQPRVAQLAAALFDDDGVLYDYFKSPIKPDGWTMPADLAEKMGHGLTQEFLEANGVPIREALERFIPLHDAADLLAAYGVDFDLKGLRGELRRAGFPDHYGEKQKFCVMRACTPHCKIPPTEAMMATGRKTFKTPNLTEAAGIMLGAKHEGAHDAGADVRMAARLFFHLVKLGSGPTIKPPGTAPAAAAPKSRPTAAAPAAGGHDPLFGE